MLQNKSRPTILKAIELQHRFKIPCTAWIDIKSYIKNDTKKEEATSSANESNFIPKENI
jgi:hypothetical protein